MALLLSFAFLGFSVFVFSQTKPATTICSTTGVAQQVTQDPSASMALITTYKDVIFFNPEGHTVSINTSPNCSPQGPQKFIPVDSIIFGILLLLFSTHRRLFPLLSSFYQAVPINNKNLPKVLFVSSFIFLGLLILYLTNNLFPSILSNPPDIELFERISGRREPSERDIASILRYWPNVFVAFSLFLPFFFSLVFGLGYSKRAKGQTWHLIKKDLHTNILNVGLLLLGVFLFFNFWPKNVEGSIQGSITFLPLLALISLFLFFYEPISEPSTLVEIEQVKGQKKQLVIVKNISLAIAIATFALSLIFVIIFALTPSKSGLAALALAVPMIAMAVGVPVPMVLYFFLKGKITREEIILEVSSPSPNLEKEDSGPINFESIKKVTLISIFALGLFFLVFLLINTVHL